MVGAHQEETYNNYQHKKDDIYDIMKPLLIYMEEQVYATWYTYRNVTYDGTTKKVMAYSDTSLSDKYWMNTPHMEGGFNYAAVVGVFDGEFWQARASNPLYAARPALYN